MAGAKKKIGLGGVRHRIEGDRTRARRKARRRGLSPADGRPRRRDGAGERRAPRLERGKNIAEKRDSLQENEDVGEFDDLEVDLLLVVEIFRFLREIAAGLANSRPKGATAARKGAYEFDGAHVDEGVLGRVVDRLEIAVETAFLLFAELDLFLHDGNRRALGRLAGFGVVGHFEVNGGESSSLTNQLFQKVRISLLEPWPKLKTMDYKVTHFPSLPGAFAITPTQIRATRAKTSPSCSRRN